MAKDTQTVNINEKTASQVVTSWGKELRRVLPASYATYRIIRKHPTISLVRALVKAAVLAGSWSVEADDDIEEDEKLAKEMKQFIGDQFLPRREHIIETALDGGNDFGWSPWEMVFGHDEGMVILEKDKALLQDLTTILVDEKNGNFEGFRQTQTGQNVDLLGRYAMLISFRVEGSNWYGEGLMENIRETYNQWREAQGGAERYDAKVAGVHWVIHYPPGTSMYDGAETPNEEVAEDFLWALESTGSIVVPDTVAAYVKELSNKNTMWKIELLEDKGGRQPTFVDRLKYLDALLVRGWLMPERAIIEGEFGTKAEAGIHMDASVMNVTLWDRQIAQSVNRQPVDELLEQNWGPEFRGKVYLVPAPLVDSQLTFLRETYTAILTNAATVLDAFPHINLDGLMDRLGVPKAEEVIDSQEETPEEGPNEARQARMASLSPGIKEDGLLRKIAKKLGIVGEEDTNGE